MMTLTEAFAELKTISKRIEKKREYVGTFLVRQDGIRDPLAKDGGAAVVIANERHAIADLETRHIAIRAAMQRTNLTTTVTVGDATKTIYEWLIWRKEIAQGSQAFVNRMRHTINTARTQAQQKGWQVIASSATPQAPTDFLVHVDEAALAAEAERLETVLAQLDGQLSLKNATVTIDV